MIGGAAIIGLIIAGGSLFARVNREGTSFKYGWPFLLIGTGVGLLIGAVVIVAARQAGLSPTRVEMTTILVVCAAVGALLGLALAPPKVDPEDVSPVTKEEQQRRADQYGNLPDGAQAGPIDRDGDGLPDLDENGDPIIGLDRDGDGTIDSYLQPCPEGSPTPRWPGEDGPIEVNYIPRSTPEPGPAEDQQVIDTDCDGTIDGVIPYSDKFLSPPGGDPGAAPPVPRPPSTISPQERADQADKQSSASIGQLFRFLGIAIAAAAAIALVAWLAVQWRNRTSDEDGDELDDGLDPPTLTPPPPTANPNFQRSIDEMINDPDPRNGILAAYGRLLIGFDEIGLGRLPHEGPQEHLDRALAASSTDPAAAKDLTEWFTRARFSSHPISEDDRRQAVESLRKVTSSMRPLTAAAGAPA